MCRFFRKAGFLHGTWGYSGDTQNWTFWMRGIESTANLGIPRYLIFYLTPNSLGDTAHGTCQHWPFFELYIDFRVPAWPSSSLGHPGLEYQENHDFR